MLVMNAPMVAFSCGLFFMPFCLACAGETWVGGTVIPKEPNVSCRHTDPRGRGPNTNGKLGLYAYEVIEELGDRVRVFNFDLNAWVMKSDLVLLGLAEQYF